MMLFLETPSEPPLSGEDPRGCDLRKRMIRVRNSIWLYTHAVETRASTATVLKLICRSELSIRLSAIMAGCIASSRRKRALRFSPSMFLCICSLQRGDDVDQVVSFLFVHLDLPGPSVRFRLSITRSVWCISALCTSRKLASVRKWAQFKQAFG